MKERGRRDQSNDLKVLDKIQATKGLLFSLADQLTNTERDRWNIIIGDDTADRPVTYMMRKILEEKEEGRHIPTYFVAGSKIYRDANGIGPYDAYFRCLAEQIGEPLRPLFITESVGTRGGMDFLEEAIAPYVENSEVATLAVSRHSQHKVTYAGGVGEEALDLVWRAYESPPEVSLGRRALRSFWHAVPEVVRTKALSHTELRITPPTSNAMIGIMVNTESDYPVAAISSERDVQLSNKVYARMGELATEYTHNKRP